LLGEAGELTVVAARGVSVLLLLLLLLLLVLLLSVSWSM
jgi:hypothetical protein